MKNRVICLFFLFVATVTLAAAQPRCNEPFNPFYICPTNFERSEYFFYGEIVSVERLQDDFVNSSGAYYRAVVKIKKSFKGKLYKEITLYLGHGFTCHSLAAKNTYLFQIGVKTMNNQKVYFAQLLSRPMTTYSAKAIKDVFANINSVLSNQKKDFIEGSVLEWLLKANEVSLKSEDADRLSINPQSIQPLADILIEATSGKDGKVYQARSNVDGTFRVDNIPNGIYKIKLHLPPNKEQQTISRGIDDSQCSRKWNIMVMPKTSNQDR